MKKVETKFNHCTEISCEESKDIFVLERITSIRPSFLSEANPVHKRVYVIESESFEERYKSQSSRNGRLNIRFLYDYLSNEDKRRIDNEVKEVVQSCQDLLSKIPLIDKFVDISFTLQYPLIIGLCKVVERIYSISKMIHVEKPRTIHIITTDNCEIWKAVAIQQNVNVVFHKSFINIQLKINYVVNNSRHIIEKYIGKLFIFALSLFSICRNRNNQFTKESRDVVLCCDRSEYNPILKQLKKSKMRVIYYDNLSLKNILNLNRRIGLKNHLLSFITFESYLLAQNKMRKLMFEAQNITSELRSLKICQVSLEDHLLRIVEHTLKEHVELVLINIESLLELKKHYRRGLLILPNDITPPMRSLAIACQKLGLKAIVIQHGFPVHPIGYIPVTADKICIWGSKIQEWFVNFETLRSKLYVSGALTGDMIFKRMNSPRFKKNRTVKDQIKILLCSEAIVKYSAFCSERIKLKALNWVMNSCRHLNNKKIVVKLHPAEDPRSYKDLIKEKEDWIEFAKDTNLHELIDDCDIFITMMSTTAFDAVLMSKPVIIIDGEMEGINLPYVNEKVAFYAASEEEVKECISNIVTKKLKAREEDRLKFILNYNDNVGEEASRRITELLIGMSEET